MLRIPLLLAFLAAPLAALAQPWQQYATPEAAGFSSAALDRVRQSADDAGSGAVMVIYQGHILAAWGDVEREFELHSVRKSLLIALYGIAIEAGEVDPDATLAELGITDREALTEAEQQARVRDLITSRSGVYLPAAYAPSSQAENRPRRGSHEPGTQWYYNNWDFNVAGVIYEQASGSDLYESFASRIAGPIGMEDWQPADGFRAFEPSLSIHPAHTFRMSTRDLARFGQLYLQEGRWGDAQVVPADGVSRSTRVLTGLGEGLGYGAMWWTFDEGSVSEHFSRRFSNLDPYSFYYGDGVGGQIVAVVPGADLVFVHRGDTDTGEGIGQNSFIFGLLDGILGARTGKPASHVDLVPLSSTPFASQQPAVEQLAVVDVDPAVLADYVGAYEIAPGVDLRVFMFADRLFGSMPGQGEAELFAIGEDAFAVRVMEGVRVSFERNPAGEVAVAHVTMPGQQFRGERK